MKKLIVFSLFFLSLQLTAQSVNPDCLKHAFNKLNLERNSENQRQFFDLFPNSYEDFQLTFGFNNGKESPLYDGLEYINTLFTLDSIPLTEQIEKWVGISINGRWEADAVNYFQQNLRQEVLSSPEPVYDYLKERPDIEIESFFFFLFNEVHPEFESIPEELNFINSRDSKIYQLLVRGHDRALKESGH